MRDFAGHINPELISRYGGKCDRGHVCFALYLTSYAAPTQSFTLYKCSQSASSRVIRWFEGFQGSIAVTKAV